MILEQISKKYIPNDRTHYKLIGRYATQELVKTQILREQKTQPIILNLSENTKSKYNIQNDDQVIVVNHEGEIFKTTN